MAIHNCCLETGYVQKFISDYSQLVNSGKTITLCWIPSHVVIRANERRDVAAKLALSSTISAEKCPPTDLYQSLTNQCQILWQLEWDGCVSNKLHSIKPTLGYVNLNHLSRWDAVILRRLCIGHTRFSPSRRPTTMYLLWLCINCCTYAPQMLSLQYCKIEILFHHNS